MYSKNFYNRMKTCSKMGWYQNGGITLDHNPYKHLTGLPKELKSDKENKVVWKWHVNKESHKSTTIALNQNYLIVK